MICYDLIFGMISYDMTWHDMTWSWHGVVMTWSLHGMVMTWHDMKWNDIITWYYDDIIWLYDVPHRHPLPSIKWLSARNAIAQAGTTPRMLSVWTLWICGRKSGMFKAPHLECSLRLSGSLPPPAIWTHNVREASLQKMGKIVFLTVINMTRLNCFNVKTNCFI